MQRRRFKQEVHSKWRLRSVLAASIVVVQSSLAAASISHFWKLDDYAASMTVVATVGSNGTFTENTDQSRASGPGGKIPYALTFDGDDEVAISSVSYSSGTAWSFSAWARFGAANAQIVGNVNTGQNRIYKSNDTTITFVTSSAFQNYTVASLGTTAWHHILVTHSTSNSVRIWVDGVESSTGAQTVAGNMSPPSIGAGNGNHFTGELAWVKFYSTDESANAEVLYRERYPIVEAFNLSQRSQ